jgi:hypothetical protein
MNGFKDNFHTVGTNIYSHPYSMESSPWLPIISFWAPYTLLAEGTRKQWIPCQSLNEMTQ